MATLGMCARLIFSMRWVFLFALWDASGLGPDQSLLPVPLAELGINGRRQRTHHSRWRFL